MIEPDFYLASSEGYGLEQPRACYIIKKIQFERRTDLYLIAIDPPIIGQGYGLGSVDIDSLVIATRHQDEVLTEPKDWPVYVHVARLLVSSSEVGSVIRHDELQHVGWAELYPTEEAAQRKLV